MVIIIIIIIIVVVVVVVVVFVRTCCYQLFKVLKLFHFATDHNETSLQIGDNILDFVTMLDF